MNDDKKNMNEAIVLKKIKYNVYGENVGMEFLQKSYSQQIGYKYNLTLHYHFKLEVL